ncbi:nitroreductase family deazaflavin-dependent oxidoreductase [Streptomyces sp. NBC_01613]|uniref:nitroreductase family deazaflavin-dependent oxidoreductase n=1 Tax=Streptomyces sp. NBC_01613 TaxID=2975896 RepID=UPI00386BAB85
MTYRNSTPIRPPLPVGLRRFVARLPVLLFRVGLGRVFGQRLLLLHHTGRMSGQSRQVILEVVAYDPAHGTWIVASGFGPKAAWYQNLRRQPQAVVQIGNRRYTVTAQFLPPEEGGAIMARYAPRHPRTARRLCAFMGFSVDGSERSFREVGQSVPFVRLAPTTAQSLP